MGPPVGRVADGGRRGRGYPHPRLSTPRGDLPALVAGGHVVAGFGVVGVDGGGGALVGGAGGAVGRALGAGVLAAGVVFLLVDVLAAAGHAHAHAEGRLGLGVGRVDALALLVGDHAAGAGRDVVGPVEDLLGVLLVAFLHLGLAALVRRHQATGVLVAARAGPRAQVGAGSLRRRLRLLRLQLVLLVHAQLLSADPRQGVADQEVDDPGPAERRLAQYQPG